MAAMSAGHQHNDADAAGRGARILIVEDEAWDAELAQRLLTSAGLGFTAVVVETEGIVRSSS